MDLDSPIKQVDFAQLVGITQPAVSDLLTRGVLKAGDPLRVWLIAYTRQLREQAAGRGADGELAANRASLTKTNDGIAQIKLKRLTGQFAAVNVIDQILAFVGKQIASALEPLPARIKMLVPQLTPDDIKAIEVVITESRNKAADMAMATLAEANADDDLDEIEDAPNE